MHQPKDYYVGVRIAKDEQTAIIVDYTTLKAITAAGSFGGARDFPAHGRLFEELEPIEYSSDLCSATGAVPIASREAERWTKTRAYVPC